MYSGKIAVPPGGGGIVVVVVVVVIYCPTVLQPITEQNANYY
jgi:hypothetical protein